MQVGTKRVHLSSRTDRALVLVRAGTGVDRSEERLAAALGEREEDAAPGCVDVEEEGRVGGGWARRRGASVTG